MQIFNVTIEQPMLASFTIEAKDEEQAHEIAKAKFEAMDNETFRREAEFGFGTDAQIQIESANGEVLTEWTDL